ncbi:MAG: ACT domain-containing protein [Heliobacteriaceae bacterium]|jgi:ACT domain-containing protein|nr:ACT domain-containing protein [Heliobacteriaceae bacterium]
MSHIIITVQGVDKVGIIASVTALLAQYEVNIEDVKQTLMQGHFVMFMLGNIEKSKYSFKEIKKVLIERGRELDMEIWVQRKEIFDNMHKLGNRDSLKG